jgi:hypothetical protein
MTLSCTSSSDFLCRYLRAQAPVSEEGMPSPALLVAVAAAAMTTSDQRHITFPNDFDPSHESKETRLQDGWIHASKASLERCTRPWSWPPSKPFNWTLLHQTAIHRTPTYTSHTPDYAPTTCCSTCLQRHPGNPQSSHDRRSGLRRVRLAYFTACTSS